jgi:N-acetylglucosamine kinase-like BadF-type ATPase
MTASQIYVGADGGGTGSRALALDPAGREVGRVQGPPALVREADAGPAAVAVAGLVRKVARVAGAPLPVARLVAGLAGAGRPAAREAVRSVLLDAGVAEDVEVLSDAEVAFHDAFGPGPGILLLSGTGSMALGRSADGRTARSGGWGDPLGDEGGGWSIGMAGLRAVTRAADGRGPDTRLGTLLLAALGLDAPADLIRWTAGATKRQVAALAPLVLQAADAGDALADELAGTGARELAHVVEAVRRSLEPWADTPAVALVGGLIAGAEAPLRRRLERALAELPVRLDPREVIPARGAASLALGRSRG